VSRSVVKSRTARFVAVAALVAGTATAAGTAGAGAAGPAVHGWVSTWTASAMAPSALISSVLTLNEQTVRNIVYTSAGGADLRIRVSNAFGEQPVTIGAATVARQLRGAEVDPATAHALTFGGSRSVVLPRGGSALSDPVRMAVPQLATLAVSLYLPGQTGQVTYHQDGQQTSYLAAGDHAADTAPDAFTTTVGSWFFVDAVQVRGPASGAILALGDSITDGFQSQVDANTRWPNYLARTLAARRGPSAPAVVDEGISGNRVLHDSPCLGVRLLDRLDRDVFSQPGVRAVVLLEGINDLGFSQTPNSGCTAPNTEVSVAELTAGYRAVIAAAHRHGLRVIGGTLLPFEGAGYWSPAAERKRVAVNAWIRGSGAFDGVVDFASVMAYPGHPELLAPQYDSGDHLHPNDGGYQAMAGAVSAASFGTAGAHS
jgi:lysophospholipase L1-like esterase